MGTLADYGIQVVQSMTQPTRPGKEPRPVWEVHGLTDGYEETLYALGGKKWRGKFSFWEDPSEALLEAIERDGKTSFADRQAGKVERAEDRAERYRERAENAAERSGALWERGHKMGEAIPFGQPILVGHHSEKRDRNYRARMHRTFEKAHEEGKKADHYRGKAAGAAWTAKPKDVGFMQRRKAEAEADLRRMQRTLERVSSPDYTARRGAEEAEREQARFAGLVAEYQERVDYWQAEIAAAGGVQHSRESVTKGDVVIYRGRACIVDRTNGKSVSVSEPHGGSYIWRHTIPYAEIREVIKPEDPRHAGLVAALRGEEVAA